MVISGYGYSLVRPVAQWCLFVLFREGFPLNLANQKKDALFSPGYWASEGSCVREVVLRTTVRQPTRAMVVVLSGFVRTMVMTPPPNKAMVTSGNFPRISSPFLFFLLCWGPPLLSTNQAKRTFFAGS